MRRGVQRGQRPAPHGRATWPAPWPTAGPGGPAPEIVGGWRLGDVRHVFASPARAAEAIGFEAEVGFAEGMAEFATAPLRAPARGTR